ncbi:MAG: hypothetical protein Kow0076_5090 [Francisella sp.]
MLNDINPELMLLIIKISIVVLIITSLVVSVFFILAQQKLSKYLSVINKNEKINPLWLWTQLIPIWSYIALIVTAIKLNDQIKLYNQLYEHKLVFKISIIYWYVILSFLSLMPLTMVLNIVIAITTIILFVLIWSNISKLNNKIKKFA